MIESCRFYVQLLRLCNLGRKATGLVASLSEQNPTQWAHEHGNLYSSCLNLKKLGVFFSLMFPGVSLHWQMFDDFSTFLKLLGTLIWVLQRPIARDVHGIVCQALPDWRSWLYERYRRTKGLGVEISLMSLSLLLSPWLRSWWCLGTGRSVTKDEEGWALLGRWTWGQLRTSDHLLLSLFMAYSGQIVKICEVWQHNPAVAMEKEILSGDFTPCI